MKLTALFVALAIAASSIAHADLIIEEEVTGQAMHTPGTGAQAPIISTLLIEVKGTKVRTTVIPARGATARSVSITDVATGAIIVIDVQRKVYRTSTFLDGESMKQTLAKSLESVYGPIPSVRPVAKPTGRKRRINGFEAEEYLAQGGNLHSALWLAPALSRYVPTFARTVTPSGGPMAMLTGLYMPDPASLPGLPVSSEITLSSKAVGVLSLMNLRSLREASIDDAEFAIPSGYVRASH